MNDHRCCYFIERDAKLLLLLANMPGMLCFQCGIHLASFLLRSERLEGDVCEFGCNRGRTAAMLAFLTKKKVWLYDSFQGLPPKQAQDVTVNGLDAGSLAVGIDEVKIYFYAHRLPDPVIVPKWFKDVQPNDLPEKIAFAHLDGDFYDSIKDSLKLVYPRMTEGGFIVIHDYGVESLQGVAPAVSDFLGTLKNCEQPSRTFDTGQGQFIIEK